MYLLFFAQGIPVLFFFYSDYVGYYLILKYLSVKYDFDRSKYCLGNSVSSWNNPLSVILCTFQYFKEYFFSYNFDFK